MASAGAFTARNDMESAVGHRAELGSPGLGGPELTFFRARLAERRGDLAGARGLALDALRALPGHDGFLRFARDIGAELPPRARQILDERPAR